jgi:HAD superfamily phosphoserine phosphatase-like hydrolase
MKYKNFPVEFWDLLSKALEEERKINPNPVAAFDADGTLWDTDLGESFFKWQIANSNLPDLPKDPWRHYRDWKESDDPRPAYLWLAQINKGQTLKQVQAWAESAVKAVEPLPVFEEQKKIIKWLLEQKVEIYVVTASVKWAVEPGALRLGLNYDNVLGIQTQIKDGIVTDHQEGVITYREGKAEAIRKATGGRSPFFASGNTMGDFALLESATQLRLAVGAAPEGHELFATEEKLRTEAKFLKWFIHKF